MVYGTRPYHTYCFLSLHSRHSSLPLHTSLLLHLHVFVCIARLNDWLIADNLNLHYAQQKQQQAKLYYFNMTSVFRPRSSPSPSRRLDASRPSRYMIRRYIFRSVVLLCLSLNAVLTLMWLTSRHLNNLDSNFLLPIISEEELVVNYEYMYKQRRALLNESSAIDLGFSERDVLGAQFFHQYFGSEIEILESWKNVSSWNDTERNSFLRDFASPLRGYLLHGRVCDAIWFFRETNGERRHVLISHINENWGAFSTTVPNRTADWGEWESIFNREGCTKEDLWWYLNHTNVSAIFTVTHQMIDHPKVFSLPLGVNELKKRMSEELTLQETMTVKNRTELLLIAISSYKHRPVIAEHVIANFNGTIRNRYKDGSDFWQNLRQAKFTLSPGGLGWDTYRAWQALCVGTIPVLETYYRKDGFYRAFDDLPVLWVNHFDNVTPSLLETSYPRILARAKECNFAKLTNQWWVDFINSYRYS